MMWNRAELKMRGNMAFKKNYVSAVVVALLMGIFGTVSGESSARRVSENSDIYSGNLFNVGMITGLLAGIATVVILIVLVAKVFVGNLLKMGGYSDYLIRVELEKPKDGQTIAENMSDAASAQTGESDSKKTWKQREKKLKFSYKEQREYETIDEDIAKLEEKIEKLDREMVKNATNSVKLSELMKEKEETETTLEEKMDRWVYLNDLAEQIENQ